ncbi:MAG: HAD family phosphatase [Balneolaceae bacterium]|nr:MAG: HAD family phosphatase [Balneolaceae bacterium]
MIKLFVTDLDGCISYPFKTPDWETISEIRRLNIQSRTDSLIPPLTVCTGRPHPYAEAVSQWLDVRIPFVFESAAMYHWEGNRVETVLDDEERALKPITEFKEWIRKVILPQFPLAGLEFSKMMDAGIVAHQKSVIDRIHPLVLEELERRNSNLEVHITDVSVNILLPGNNKGRGIKMLADSQSVGLSEVAYIGDTGGDVPALKLVAMPFSPENATRAVKDVSEALPMKTSSAVLEAYRRVIEYNRAAQ